MLRLTGGAGADVVLESAGGATFDASLAAAKRVTGRVVVYGVAGGEAPVTNWELVYKHQVHVIGLNIGVLIQAAPQIFGEVMRELSALIAAGVPASAGLPRTTWPTARNARGTGNQGNRRQTGPAALRKPWYRAGAPHTGGSMTGVEQMIATVDPAAKQMARYVVMYDTSDVDAFDVTTTMSTAPVGGTVSGPASLHAQS